MPISLALCIFQPGSVNSGGTWHRAQPAFELKICSPRMFRYVRFSGRITRTISSFVGGNKELARLYLSGEREVGHGPAVELSHSHAQRLARRLCLVCREQYTADAAEFTGKGWDGATVRQTFGAGCGAVAAGP